MTVISLIILQTVFLSLTVREILHSMKAATQITLKRKNVKAFQRKSSASKNVSADSAEEKESIKTWKQNRPSKLKFSYKEQREFETIDDDIAVLESKIEKLDADIMANATNSGKLNELTQQKEEAEAQLEEKMDRWVYLNDLAEQIEAQK